MVISILDWVVSPDSQVISQVVSQPNTKGTKVNTVDTILLRYASCSTFMPLGIFEVHFDCILVVLPRRALFFHLVVTFRGSAKESSCLVV